MTVTTRAVAVVVTVVTAMTATVPAGATRGAGNVVSDPQLSVAINDDHTQADVGDTLTYTVTVRNLGDLAVTGLDVTQTIPAGVRVTATSPAGRTHALTVDWNVNLAAGGEASLHSTVNVTRVPPGTLRLASVACVSAAGSPRRLVCATHSDQLPTVDPTTANAAAGGAGRGWWYITAGLVALCGSVLMAMLLRCRASQAG